MVQMFHKVYDCERRALPNINFDELLVGLRLKLIDEEYEELLQGLANRDVVEVADALTDLLYVIYGFGVSLGINLDETFREVHASNLTKLDENGKPIRRPDGKIVKGPHFRLPDLKRVLENRQPMQC